jgi:hypothetical protein
MKLTSETHSSGTITEGTIKIGDVSEDSQFEPTYLHTGTTRRDGRPYMEQFRNIDLFAFRPHSVGHIDLN